MKRLIALCFLVFFTTSFYAQTLQRKGALGVMIKNQDDKKSILVEGVLDNGTAADLGLKKDDILLTVNKKEYNDIADLVALTKTWRAGDKVKITVLRNGKTKKLKGKVVSKPIETSKYAKVIYGAVPFDGGQLRSILELPNGVKNPPVVFLLPGFGCGSLDYWYDEGVPIKQLVEGLVKDGIAVYRVEKPGMGDSQNEIDCESMGFNYEVKAFNTALKYLKTIKEIDKDNVFLYGHSLGGVTAPLLGAKNSVKGIICWGSMSNSWYEYHLKILRDRPIQRGTDYAEIEEAFRQRQPVIYDYLINKLTPEQLAAKGEVYQEVLKDYFHLNNGKIRGMHYTYAQEINDVNFAEAWKKAQCAVLALHGEHDFNAIDSEWAEHTANMVNAFHPGKGSWKVIDGTEHHYSKVPSMEEHIKMLDEGQMTSKYIAENFNPEIINVVKDWIRNQLI